MNKDRIEQYGLFAIGRQEPLFVATKDNEQALRETAKRTGSLYFVARLLDPLKPVRGRKNI